MAPLHTADWHYEEVAKAPFASVASVGGDSSRGSTTTTRNQVSFVHVELD